MTVSAVRPWRTALQRERSLPSSVVGPVLLRALRRLASICLRELIGYSIHKIGFVLLVASNSQSESAFFSRSKLCPAPEPASVKPCDLVCPSTFTGGFGGIGWLHQFSCGRF